MQHYELYEGVASPAVSFDLSTQRPRIKALVLEAVKKPLTVIIANVGFGKTQAASTLYETSDARIIWLQLTQLDNFPSRFWDRLAYAVKTYNAELSDELRGVTFSDDIVSINRCLLKISEALAHAKVQYIVVLDDFHVINNTGLLNILGLMITARVPRLSIVITSNERPRLNLEALEEKGVLSLITQDILRLTDAEIIEYYALHDIKISEHTAINIYNRTEGWLFAVYLIGLSLKKGTFSEENPIKEGLLDIFALIETDIYELMSPNVRHFFLKISIFDNVSPKLMEMLAGDDAKILSEVMRWNSVLLRFNTLTGRYHIMKLFREFMLERHNDLNEDEIVSLNRAAAQWCEANGYKIEAIHYYKGCGDFSRIFNIILEFTNRCPREIADLFINLIEQAPPEDIAQRPILLVARAKYLLNNGKVYDAHETVIQLRDEYEAMSDSPIQRAMLGEIYIMLGIMSLVVKTLDFVDCFKRADILLPNGSEIFDNKMMLVCGASYIPIRDLSHGSVKKVMQAFFQAMPSAVRVMNGCAAGLEYLVAAEIDFATGDLKNAEKNAYAALYLAQAKQQYDIECMAHSLMLRVFICHGDYRRASVTLETVNKYLKVVSPDCAVLCDVIVSSYYARLGRTEKISRWIWEDTGEGEAKALAPISFTRGQRVRAQYYLVKGQYYELLGYLNYLDKLYQVNNSLFGIIENTIMRAIANYYIGERGLALQMLEKSYQLSFENNIIMLYVEQGKWMRTLVHAARLDENCSIPPKWLDLVYSKATTYAKRVSLINNEHTMLGSDESRREIRLTKREQEVLTGLCQGLTREQIAQSHGISANTVKGMLPIIYNKLGAINSFDAVRIAISKNIVT